MSLLPSSGPDVRPTQEGDVQIVGIESEETEGVMSAIASETARELLAEIYKEPAVPTELAKRLDMSLQRVSYHLDKLKEASLIRIAGTRYSEKGQEMKIFAPPDDPLVLFIGTEERKYSFTDLLKRLVPATAILAVVSFVAQVLIESLRTTGDGLGPGGEPVPVEPLVAPGILVFIGGLLVIGLGIGWWVWQNRR